MKRNTISTYCKGFLLASLCATAALTVSEGQAQIVVNPTNNVYTTNYPTTYNGSDITVWTNALSGRGVSLGTQSGAARYSYSFTSDKKVTGTSGSFPTYMEYAVTNSADTNGLRYTGITFSYQSNYWLLSAYSTNITIVKPPVTKATIIYTNFISSNFTYSVTYTNIATNPPPDLIVGVTNVTVTLVTNPVKWGTNFATTIETNISYHATLYYGGTNASGPYTTEVGTYDVEGAWRTDAAATLPPQLDGQWMAVRNDSSGTTNEWDGAWNFTKVTAYDGTYWAGASGVELSKGRSVVSYPSPNTMIVHAQDDKTGAFYHWVLSFSGTTGGYARGSYSLSTVDKTGLGGLNYYTGHFQFYKP